MTLLAALYTLIISPLELLFEVVFTVANRIIGNAGLSIIFLSLAVNFLVLPLYKRADELQAEERDIQVRMAPMIKHIKSTFKGDERFMMLQEYYKINHYKPVYALKSTASLLLQIPFFIAAYNLLFGMQSLQGMQFGPIADLGKEDAMFMIGSFPVNVLPILMTLINIVSGIIYTKGHPVKEKIQVYGLAAVFLVLLYRSPSGLVFYWLLNNVFSLVKNVFYKLKDPKKALNIVLAVAGAVILVLTLIRPDLDARQKFLLATGSVLLAVPFISGFIKTKPKEVKEAQNSRKIFFLGAVMMALITGLLIPSTVINAAPEDFIDYIHKYNPGFYIFNALIMALGSWVLWGGVFFFFAGNKAKAVFAKAIWIICGVSVADYMLFGTKLGIISSLLQYDKRPVFELSEYVINLAAIAAVSALFYLIYKKLPVVAETVILVGILAVIGIGTINTATVLGVYAWNTKFTRPSTEMPEIPLSRNGKNVVVLMLDRGLGTLVPYIMNEKPELKEQFDGFTYYPNTMSYGTRTFFAAPALFGGYEYTPENLNNRPDEKLVDKHNESLKVLPVLFKDNGYEVTVCDPPYAGYQNIPDLSIYDDYPEFHCYNTAGKFNYLEDLLGESSIDTSARMREIRDRNFFCFSMMKISPLILQDTLYDGGKYNESATSGEVNTSDSISAGAIVQDMVGLSRSVGYMKDILFSYPVLTHLPDITEVSDSSDNTFLMMSNDTPHSFGLLQEPDYVPAYWVDNTAYDVNMVERYTVDGVTLPLETEEQVAHYHPNMAAFIQLGKWFDYLREQGVYDNTRIIIVADHGRGLDQFDIKCNGLDMEFYLPLFMVKDFDATGFTVSDEFMTNADTPTLATSGLIEDPHNPFSGNPINSDPKQGPQRVIYSDECDLENNNGYTYEPSVWYVLDGNPHNASDWSYEGDN